MDNALPPAEACVRPAAEASYLNVMLAPCRINNGLSSKEKRRARMTCWNNELLRDVKGERGGRPLVGNKLSSMRETARCLKIINGPSMHRRRTQWNHIQSPGADGVFAFIFLSFPVSTSSFCSFILLVHSYSCWSYRKQRRENTEFTLWTSKHPHNIRLK